MLEFFLGSIAGFITSRLVDHYWVKSQSEVPPIIILGWKSFRHGIAYTKVPSKYTAMDYGAMLDSVYEMADETISSVGGYDKSPNRVENGHAIVQDICHQEGWEILPSHKSMICFLLFNRGQSHGRED